jgi:hypothetical protein
MRLNKTQSVQKDICLMNFLLIIIWKEDFFAIDFQRCFRKWHQRSPKSRRNFKWTENIKFWSMPMITDWVETWKLQKKKRTQKLY